MKYILFLVAVMAGIQLISGCSYPSDPVEADSKTTVPHASTASYTMLTVPAGGTFIMGEHVENITQEVTLTKDFLMGKTEVTQGLWNDIWDAPIPAICPSGQDIPVIGE